VYGLQAISNANGWAMAFAGAAIVFAGLAVLSFVISQLHKLVSLWDSFTKKAPASDAREGAEPKKTHNIVVPAQWPADARSEALLYTPLLAELGETVELATLYQACRRYDFPHPHLTINRLRDAGYLVDAGDGKVNWVFNPGG
jgi:Na+-transporting methylmalonyl-CoA/oxaloacetate decarboxylase gamma subunit